jgi:holo-[acyl-carrier protein] synthase
VIGIGTDLVDVVRFRAVVARTPGIVERLFLPGEQAYATERRDPTERYAARFAAKEATMKALGVGIGAVGFRDIEVLRDEEGAPSLRLHGRAADRAAALGVRRWLLSMTHTDTVAHAVAVALGEGR